MTDIRITVTADNDLPAVGAYLAGSATEGEMQIRLNMRFAFLAAAKEGRAEFFRDIINHTLAHEVLHGCQELMGEVFREDDIEIGLARAHGASEEEMATIAESEDVEQVVQEQANEIQGLLMQLQRYKDIYGELPGDPTLPAYGDR